MTDKEKARRYDEVIEKAKKVKDNPFAGYDGTDLISALFPELKESEDEEVRKGIISGMKALQERKYTRFANIPMGDVLAWLEKQGENKTTWSEEDERIRTELIAHCKNTRCVTEEGAERIAKWIDWLEKQGEQKAADKVELKFHVNEWVVTDKNNVVHIKAIENGKYVLENTMSFTVDYVDKCWRKWTIQDAKDGDVLVNQNGEMPFIFKEHKNNHIYCYCGYTNRKDIFFDGFVDSEGEELHWLNLYHEQAYPATKEQRDLLFTKMKEAGYKWDAEKKELKKIGNKNPMLSDFFKAEYERGKADAQKPTWSEEDEKTLNSILWCIEHCQDEDIDARYDGNRYVNPRRYITMSAWLKSLRPQNVWISVDEEVYVKEPVLAQKKDKSDPFKGYVVCCDHTLTPNVYERYIRLDNNCSQNR